MTDHIITPDEAKAIASLKRLAKRWPRTLTLASMAGSLVVVHTDDEAFHNIIGAGAGPGERAENVLAYLGADIPNTGGDW